MQRLRKTDSFINSVSMWELERLATPSPLLPEDKFITKSWFDFKVEITADLKS